MKRKPKARHFGRLFFTTCVVCGWGLVNLWRIGKRVYISECAYYPCGATGYFLGKKKAEAAAERYL